MSIEVINEYAFSNDKESIVYEIKFPTAYNGKENMYQWYLIYRGNRYTLKFIRMENNVRTLYNDDTGETIIDLDKNLITVEKFNIKSQPLTNDKRPSVRS